MVNKKRLIVTISACDWSLHLLDFVEIVGNSKGILIIFLGSSDCSGCGIYPQLSKELTWLLGVVIIRQPLNLISHKVSATSCHKCRLRNMYFYLWTRHSEERFGDCSAWIEIWWKEPLTRDEGGMGLMWKFNLKCRGLLRLKTSEKTPTSMLVTNCLSIPFHLK